MVQAQSKLTYSLILIVGSLTLCPVIMLLLGSFSKGLTAFGSFTLDKYIQAYTDPAFFEVIANTIVFVLGSSTLATGLALFLAYLNNRTDIPFKFLFQIISIIPMMIPHLLFAVSWGLLLNPSNGIMNLVLRQTFSLESAPFNIYSLAGMILVEGLLELPIAYLIIAPAMGSFDVTLEESSRVFGAGTWLTLRRVTLPVLRPAILAAFILSVVRSLASFAVPSVLGMPGRVYVLATYLYEMIARGFAPDYGKAAAVGMSVLAVSVILIIVYRALTSESERYVTISSRGFRPAVIELKGARIPLFLVVGLLSLILIVLPVAVLFYTSLVPYAMVPSARAFSLMSWKHWIQVLEDPISVLSLKNSLLLGVAGATLGVLLSIFVAYVIVKVRSTASGILESLSYLSF
ncbi:MAG: ABC transporter permease, partial [Nitrospirota bacterium]